MTQSVADTYLRNTWGTKMVDVAIQDVQTLRKWAIEEGRDMDAAKFDQAIELIEYASGRRDEISGAQVPDDALAAKDAEIERLTEAHKDCDYAIDNNYRAWQEAQAEIVALKASRDRLRVAFLAAMRCYHADSWERPETIREINDALEAACDALQDGDVADADPVPDADAGMEGE